MWKSKYGPRQPLLNNEAFAIGFMVGYLGYAPDELSGAFPDVGDWTQGSPFAFPVDYARGYESGVSFFSSHLECSN